jgi:hypothetical protein
LQYIRLGFAQDLRIKPQPKNNRRLMLGGSNENQGVGKIGLSQLNFALAM